MCASQPKQWSAGNEWQIIRSLSLRLRCGPLAQIAQDQPAYDRMDSVDAIWLRAHVGRSGETLDMKKMRPKIHMLDARQYAKVQQQHHAATKKAQRIANASYRRIFACLCY